MFFSLRTLTIKSMCKEDHMTFVDLQVHLALGKTADSSTSSKYLAIEIEASAHISSEKKTDEFFAQLLDSSKHQHS